MRPQDVDKIANLVVGSLTGTPGFGLLGCGAISSGQNYELNECTDPNAPFLVCDDGGTYECGGQGNFLCCAGFTCTTTFTCPGPAPFGCLNGQQFVCANTFTCGEQDTFAPTSGLCGT